MGFEDYVVNFALAVVLIVGAYQFYFLPQRRPFRAPRLFVNQIDERIPFWPKWVWVYSGLYYPIIIALIFTMGSFEQFNKTAFSFLCLLLTQIICFYLFPVKTPDSWREFGEEKSLSARFLRFVHSFDAQTNCFPSMHVSVATLTAIHMAENIAPVMGGSVIVVYAFPILIGLSAIFTKQHYVIDLPAGAALGYANYMLFKLYGV